MDISDGRQVFSQMDEPGLKPTWSETVEVPIDTHLFWVDFTTTHAPLWFTWYNLHPLASLDISLPISNSAEVWYVEKAEKET